MAGGFLVPILMALILPLIAAGSPPLAPAVRAAGRSLAVAAILLDATPARAPARRVA
ncbi:hypothetical protein [Nonomuraea candida]|uniref:hypothetical protein n=1 Tax=Nonomuraea candida TaxID=359159 RepID=UPI000AF5C778|nr:hypothetical protein [Nonomuraea candida]